MRVFPKQIFNIKKIVGAFYTVSQSMSLFSVAEREDLEMTLCIPSLTAISAGFPKSVVIPDQSLNVFAALLVKLRQLCGHFCVHDCELVASVSVLERYPEASWSSCQAQCKKASICGLGKGT